jgi:hypothetical protein
MDKIDSASCHLAYGKIWPQKESKQRQAELKVVRSEGILIFPESLDPTKPMFQKLDITVIGVKTLYYVHL